MNRKPFIRRAIALVSVALLLVLFSASAFAAIVPKAQFAKVEKKDHTLTATPAFDANDLLDFKATYPEFTANPQSLLKTINASYRDKANSYYSYAMSTLYKAAMDDYNSSLTSGYPFRMYGAGLDTAVSLNDNSLLSTTTDQYIYTGGAHGSTVRTSDNWNLATGKRFRMKDLFKNKPNYRTLVLQQVLKMADEQKAKDAFYFEEYRDLIKKYFNVDSFYLTPTGMVVYFQQYEVAPYAAGFVSFEIPYETLGISPSYKTLP